nr:MAG TPA: hypothetical protein [Caudoviricetes sp.]
MFTKIGLTKPLRAYYLLIFHYICPSKFVFNGYI